jgi:hypothetical protein
VTTRKTIVRGESASVRTDFGVAAHDVNNLLQAAISGLELIQIRARQGRTSEILALIEKVCSTLGTMTDLTRRSQIARAETYEIDSSLDGGLL